MKKMLALFSAVFLVGALSSANAWAGDPVVDTLDRHSVWSKFLEDREKDSSESSDMESKDTGKAEKADSDQVKMKIKPEDKPWGRVG